MTAAIFLTGFVAIVALGVFLSQRTDNRRRAAGWHSSADGTGFPLGGADGGSSDSVSMGCGGGGGGCGGGGS